MGLHRAGFEVVGVDIKKGIIYFTCTLIHKGFSIVGNILDLRGVLGENVVVGSTT